MSKVMMSMDELLASSSVAELKTGDEVEGKVTRITPFGAFVQLGPAVEALVHVSEMSDEEGVDPEKIFELNQKKKFKIIDIDTDSRKIALSLKGTAAKPAKAKKTAKE